VVQQRSFALLALPPFFATPGPTVTVSPSADFPVFPVIRLTLLQRFPGGEEGGDGFSSFWTRPGHHAGAKNPLE
jgi:hypothetical protein